MFIITQFLLLSVQKMYRKQVEYYFYTGSINVKSLLMAYSKLKNVGGNATFLVLPIRIFSAFATIAITFVV